MYTLPKINAFILAGIVATQQFLNSTNNPMLPPVTSMLTLVLLSVHRIPLPADSIERRLVVMDIKRQIDEQVADFLQRRQAAQTEYNSAQQV